MVSLIGEKEIMNSLILRVASGFLTILMLLFALFILWRGHNNPGGGFIAGLIASAALGLYTMANGVEKAQRLIRWPVFYYLATGITISVVAAVSPLFLGQPFFTGLWFGASWFSVGTPMLFDIGVFLTVVSAVLMMIFVLESKPESD
ncbi:MAG: Na(+)/H(+) antiporter subunit B [Gammaproteobacteria bacterium CG11_big_fil_rev_8_21_14_0_20_46_22]|nr:MAG: Na(+)/H(+) antiporter subunit B [Gammaproteobacteria bacterium CG12_big_fil_rev_8_21_14_0_65_46_12]PIR11134.1 MAG: Na(+)/H(+) antiporter subunit B [Gammaproteobacteria bacterium CG11_big_fil_rev_8_21_14_0_20_46_22]